LQPVKQSNIKSNILKNKTNKYMKQSQKKKFRKELTEFAKSYERKPNYIDAVRRVQGLEEWYRDLDRQNLTEDVIDAMASHYDNQTISEGRIYISNNLNYKE
jgi:hypothetical protein